MLSNFLAQNATFSEKNFPILATLTADSNITNTTRHPTKTPSRISHCFCYGCFKDLLALTTFAKSFGFWLVQFPKYLRLKMRLEKNRNIN